MKVHLVTYATPRFRHRQILLATSAIINGVANTVTCWTSEKLRKAGFEERCRGIKISERGSGDRAWKPFIILNKLREVPDGDLIIYCDVGRRFPYKQFTRKLDGFLDWMSENQQDVMPGLQIPWKGPMETWTKRDAFVVTEMDRAEVYQAIPIQASFSFWRKTENSRAILEEWLHLASQRMLVSDDASVCGLPELPNFHDHRHDQSLLTLVCMKHKIQGLSIGETSPQIDTQDPSEIAGLVFSTPRFDPTVIGRLLKFLCYTLEQIEQRMRKILKFGEPLPDPKKWP